MKTSHHIIILPFLLAIAGCNPTPRYALHEANEPTTGAKVTLRIDTRTGETLSLSSIPTMPGGRILFWAPVMDKDVAFEFIKVLNVGTNRSATNSQGQDPESTNWGKPMTIK